VTKTAGINKAEALYAELNAKHFEEGCKLNNRKLLCEAAQKARDHAYSQQFLCS
jgi:hypothetical protein